MGVFADLLSHFDGYFHLFAIANLGWAGSKRFREAIDDQIVNSIDKADKDIKSFIDGLMDNIVKESNITDGHRKTINDCLILSKQIYNSKIYKIQKDCDKKYEFVNSFKSMFFLTALYCLCILILGGFEQFFSSNNPNFISNILTILDFCLLYNIYVFIRSTDMTKSITPIPIWKPLLFLFIVVIALILYSEIPALSVIDFKLGAKLSISISLFIACSPFIFHFIKVFINNYYFMQKIASLKESTMYEFEKIIKIENIYFQFSKQEENKLKEIEPLNIGYLITINKPEFINEQKNKIQTSINEYKTENPHHNLEYLITVSPISDLGPYYNDKVIVNAIPININ